MKLEDINTRRIDRNYAIIVGLWILGFLVLEFGLANRFILVQYLALSSTALFLFLLKTTLSVVKTMMTEGRLRLRTLILGIAIYLTAVIAWFILRYLKWGILL